MKTVDAGHEGISPPTTGIIETHGRMLHKDHPQHPYVLSNHLIPVSGAGSSPALTISHGIPWAGQWPRALTAPAANFGYFVWANV